MNKLILFLSIAMITTKASAMKLSLLLLAGVSCLTDASQIAQTRTVLQENKVEDTYHAQVNTLGGVTPAEQMRYIASLENGCQDAAERAMNHALDKAVKARTASCFLENDNTEISMSITWQASHGHVLQNFCAGSTYGIKYLSQYNDNTVQMFFTETGELISSAVTKESISEYLLGYNNNYLVVLAKPQVSRGCITEKQDIFSGISEAEEDSDVANQIYRTIGYINGKNKNRTKMYATEGSEGTNADYIVSDIVNNNTCLDCLVLYYQELHKDVMLTTTYAHGALQNYNLLMKNKDGTTDSVDIGKGLVISNTLSTAQDFEELMQNAGKKAIITMSGKGNKRKSSRIDILTPTADDSPTASAKENLAASDKLNGQSSPTETDNQIRIKVEKTTTPCVKEMVKETHPNGTVHYKESLTCDEERQVQS